MLITTLATLILGQSAALTCPVMGSPITGKGVGAFDYNGARYVMCCGGCPAPFQADPAKYLKQSAEKKLTVGTFLYDPTTGVKIDPKKAAGGSSDFGGLRYFFANKDGKKAFDAEPKKFATAPKKEVLWCAVMNHGLVDYAAAGAYVDQGDTRYYLCCDGCLGKMKEKTSEYVARMTGKAQTPRALPVKN